MRRAIAPLILLLFVLAGCEIEKDPVYEPLDPSLHFTDGFCLLSNSREDLDQENGRIWLGDLDLHAEVVIQ
jgi:hypothetical protein